MAATISSAFDLPRRFCFDMVPFVVPESRFSLDVDGAPCSNLTHVVPYYNDAEYLHTKVLEWAALPEEVRRQVTPVL